ncbi:nicotinamide mononucleotide transporter [Mucilaginibacter gracilis]|uniref:Nicotinamide riboside transporter PnuC n=2 Tax=Mucilaginibacter gracilis TaxID=423350 RepID=A0A495IWU4_9SPHI|nr:nicotinamide mononucleotide transporter [Mucilaginibacter gracilis]
MHQLMQLLMEQIKATTPIEWIAVAMSVAEVLLARINNVWLYPTGIIGTVLGIYLLLNVHLYGESLLNVYYLVMSFYGWYYWLKKKGEPPVKITWSSRTEWVVTLSITFIGWAILYAILNHGFVFWRFNFPPSNVPIWDAFVSSSAWAGMWLLARRKIENWLLLNLSNVFAVPLLFYKHLPLFGFLTIFLFVIGVWGFIDWIKIYNKEKSSVLLAA